MNTILSTVLLLSLVATGYSLRCYVCNSHLDEACGEPFYGESPAINSRFGVQCREDLGKPFCRKTKTYFAINGETRIHRDCGYEERLGYDCYQKRSEDYVSDVCQCKSDYCNSGTKFGVAALALSIPLVLATMV